MSSLFDIEWTPESIAAAAAVYGTLTEDGIRSILDAALDHAKVTAVPVLGVPSLTIPDTAWTPCGDSVEAQREWLADGESPQGDERSELITTVSVCGTLMHAKAYEVTDSDDTGMQAIQGGDDGEMDRIHSAVAASGAWETTTIAGRLYIIVITPFC